MIRYSPGLFTITFVHNSYYTEEQRRVNVYFERKLEFVLSYLTPTLSLSLPNFPTD